MGKMKRKFIVMVSLLLLLVGCGKKEEVNQAYTQAMQKAKETIVEKKFEQAEGFIELALESDSTNNEAKNMLKQLILYIEGTSLKEAKEYEKAQEKFKSVSELKDGSEKLVDYATEEIENLRTLLGAEKELMTEFDLAKRLAEGDKYEESNSKLELILNKDFSMARDTKLKESAQTLFDGNKAKLDEQAKIVVHNKEEAAQKLAEGMPQVAGAQFVEEREGVYYFTAISGLARWELTVNQAGELSESMVEDTSPATKGIDWEQIARSKVASQFPTFEVASFEEVTATVMNVFIKNKETGELASHAVGSIDTETGETSGF